MGGKKFYDNGGIYLAVAVPCAVIGYYLLAFSSQFIHVAMFSGDVVIWLLISVAFAVTMLLISRSYPVVAGMVGALLLLFAAVSLISGWGVAMNNLPSPVDLLSIFTAGGCSPAVWITGIALLFSALFREKVNK